MKIIKKSCVFMPFFVVILILLNLGIYASAETQSGEALDYRMRGYKLQNEGQLDQAMQYYKKAIQLDPTYATPHNDLGVIYEMQNRLDLAEQSYLAALQIDPNYSGVYSNLASLYEKKGDLSRAIAYWDKRSKMGNPSDPWVQKAMANSQRLNGLLTTGVASTYTAPVVYDSSVAPSIPAYNTNENERALAMHIADMLASEEAQKDSAATYAYPDTDMSYGSYGGYGYSDKKAVNRLMSDARYDIRQERYQNALDKLYEAKTLTSDPKEVNELIDDARSRAIDYDLARTSMNADLYKKSKLLEVEEAWFPPMPEQGALEQITQDLIKQTEKSAARLELEKKAKLIISSIDFTDARLKEVIEFLAVSNDINIVIDETVVPESETVTVHLKNIPLDEALDILLRTKGLKYRFEENIIWITSEEKLLEEDLVVKVYDVQDLVGKLYDFPSQPFDFTANLALADEE